MSSDAKTRAKATEILKNNNAINAVVKLNASGRPISAQELAAQTKMNAKPLAKMARDLAAPKSGGQRGGAGRQGDVSVTNIYNVTAPVTRYEALEISRQASRRLAHK